MSTTIAVGNYLTLQGSGNTFRYQNFHINQTATFNSQTYSFLPFGFSGVSINRSGDNTDASLVFPNNALARSWGISALENRWLATVYVLALNPDNTSAGTLMHTYVGAVAEGSWDETALNLTLNTVLDAVGSDVPMRRITQLLVGALPTSSSVRLQ
jgi:hypothetical protein